MQTRAFASVLSEVPPNPEPIAASGSKEPPHSLKGSSRPSFGIEVDPNHGLYGFFRRTEKDGEVEYQTLEANMRTNTASGMVSCYTRVQPFF